MGVAEVLGLAQHWVKQHRAEVVVEVFLWLAVVNLRCIDVESL